nr:biotin transporter BioY [Evansella caseinilytica]
MRDSKTASFSVIELTKGAMFIALMAIGANLTAFITIGAVPLTFQTVIAILAGVVLGRKTGTFSMIGYAIVGLVGAPVFAGFEGGLHIITRPTFGFILSFIAIAFVVGSIVNRAKAPSFGMFLFASYIGLLINYGIGVPYLYYYSTIVLSSADVSFSAIALSMGPFFIKDAVLTGLIATICPQLIHTLNRTSSREVHSRHTV